MYCSSRRSLAVEAVVQAARAGRKESCPDCEAIITKTLAPVAAQAAELTCAEFPSTTAPSPPKVLLIITSSLLSLVSQYSSASPIPEVCSLSHIYTPIDITTPNMMNRT
jgi:hypothetical protein